MKGPLLLILAALLTGSPASAQLATTHAGGGSAAIPYVGPGDVVGSALVWYGARAYSASYALSGGKAFALRRGSDSTVCDFDVNSAGNLGNSDSGCSLGGGLSLATFATQDATCTGTISGTTLSCTSASSTPHVGSTLTGTGITLPSYITACGTFTGGTGTCTLQASQTVGVGETITMTYGLYVDTAYDQSGHGITIAAGAKDTTEAHLIPNAFNNEPCIVLSGSQGLTETGAFSTTAIPYTYSAVAKNNGSTTVAIEGTFNGGVGGELGFHNNAANQVFLYANSFLNATASDSGAHAFQGVVATGSTGVINVDGTETTGTTGTSSTSTSNGVGISPSGTLAMTGYVCEAGIWGSAISSGNRSTMHTNQSTYWGTP